MMVMSRLELSLSTLVIQMLAPKHTSTRMNEMIIIVLLIFHISIF